MAARVLFLPGASGSGAFWEPVARLLPEAWETVCLDLPGLGTVPPDPRVRSFDDLVELALERIGDQPVDLVAQSMGGVVAVKAALRRPELVRRLVLTATSGGVDLRPFGVTDWRRTYRKSFQAAAPWVTEYRVDLSDQIPAIQAPTLLIWSDADPISPPAVGAHLASLFPHATLVVIPGGNHMFARDHALDVAPHILRHLDR